MIKYDIVLKGINEFYPKLNNKTYNILKVDNKEKQKFMCDIINEFIKSQNKNLTEKHYIGIDYEFNKVMKNMKDIALMQLNLENDSNIGYIFILYPPELSKDNLNTIIRLLTNENIYKILHGAESLDIPYIYNQLLKTKDNINKFCMNFYDTKYLCDYYNLENNISTKCSIYDLLLNQKIVTQDKINWLNKIEEKMGPIYLIKINIHNLSNYVLNYSLYDVIYLPELLKKFINIPEPRNIFYSKIIPEISCVIHSYKRNIDNTFTNIELLINNMNIYFVKKDKTTVSLQEMYCKYIEKITLPKITEIHYFKKFLNIIYKLIVYYHITMNNIVYKNNKEEFRKDKIKQYIEWIKQYKYIYDVVNIIN